MTQFVRNYKVQFFDVTRQLTCKTLHVVKTICPVVLCVTKMLHSAKMFGFYRCMWLVCSSSHPRELTSYSLINIQVSNRHHNDSSSSSAVHRRRSTSACENLERIQEMWKKETWIGKCKPPVGIDTNIEMSLKWPFLLYVNQWKLHTKKAAKKLI